MEICLFLLHFRRNDWLESGEISSRTLPDPHSHIYLDDSLEWAHPLPSILPSLPRNLLHETTICRREARPAFPPAILSSAQITGSEAPGCADSHALAGPHCLGRNFQLRTLGQCLQAIEPHHRGDSLCHWKVIPRVQLQPGRSLRIVPIKKYSHWQEISMRRMEAINRHIAEVSHQEVNYLFCLDIDMVFHNPWGVETLGEMVAAIHPGYFNVPRSQFPYERRSSSAAFIPDRQGDFYYAGAVFGGLVKQVYEFTRACHMTILADKANGIMAAWQEESHLNRHFFSHKPSKLLSPEYVWDDTKPRPPEVRLIRFSTVNKNYKELRD
ncbi:globoside alpha-1,3-N-acetylgalactosaminyltransferase 1 isoform 3-T5 [Macrochelys suwanniensis]